MGCPLCGSKRGGGGRGGGCGIVPTGPLGRITVCMPGAELNGNTENGGYCPEGLCPGGLGLF